PAAAARHPGVTGEQLQRARPYAYGGSVIQDLGYYPFGSRFFSNLLHYVRTGDFIESILRSARNADEYAFALGALAHYAADNVGHPEAVNRSVAFIWSCWRGTGSAVLPMCRGSCARISSITAPEARDLAPPAKNAGAPG